MNKSLFNDDEKYINEALRLEGEVYGVLFCIIRPWINEGFKIRELEYLCLEAVIDLCSSKRLDKVAVG